MGGADTLIGGDGINDFYGDSDSGIVAMGGADTLIGGNGSWNFFVGTATPGMWAWVVMTS